MKQTQITLHSDYSIGTVDPRIFGGFLEHLGRAVYQGVYEPGSVHADTDGLRTDVLSALREMRLTAMRYPGGNFASGYHWLDGIGPREQRPTLRELAWQSIETNHFGTDEFMKLARLMNWTPMLTVNLGTGTPEEARNWLEYCNSQPGTKYADMRVKNGSRDSHGIKLWCLGNEMDGPWQLGHVPAGEYAIRAQQAAKLMKDTDPEIELVASGSCTTTLPSYLEWDRVILEYIGDQADYISLHRYVGNSNSNTADYLAVTNSIDQQIEEMDAACRYVQARMRRKKRQFLCFDEWNVWYRATAAEHTNGRDQFAPHLIEEEYNLEDALVVAGFLNSFIRHADVVKIANLAQIVNAIAPIHTDGDNMLLHTIYYPFVMYARRRDGVALNLRVKGPGYDSPSYGYVDMIDASAIQGDGIVHVFLVNRSQSESAPVKIDMAGMPLTHVESAEIVTGPTATTGNTFKNTMSIYSQVFKDVQLIEGGATLLLPPLSATAITFKV